MVSPNGDLLRAGTVNPSATHEVDGKSIGLVSVEPVILIRTADGKTDSKAAKLTQGKVYVNGGYHCEVGGDGTELKLPEGEHTIKVTGKKMATPFRNSPGG